MGMKNRELLVEVMSCDDAVIFESEAESTQNYDTLEKARGFATIAHSGALRKDGKTPYIVHPERVVKTLQSLGVEDKEVLAAAYLHDVLEDTPAKLEGEFPERVIKIVKALTKAKGSSKADYLNGLRGAPWEAVLIKMADRYDNIIDGANTPELGAAWLPKYLASTDTILAVAKASGAMKNPAGAKLFKMLGDLRKKHSAPAPV